MCVIADKLVSKGMEQGIEQGRLLTICSLIKDGMLKLEDGAFFLNLSVDVLNKKVCEL